MSEIPDRRAAKKARTRQHVRGVAQRMFAESGFDAVTIADVAREAHVAVQTVFNHFSTKEELFFDGRVPWIDGPAEAVRRRAAGVSPLTALRAHLVEGAGHFLTVQLSSEGRAFAEALTACPALAAYEQQAVLAAELQLAEALAEAWSTDPEPGTASDGTAIARVTAAVWLAACRVVFVEQRRMALESGDPCGNRRHVEQVMDAVLTVVQAGFGGQQGVAVPVWEPAPVRRAG